MTFNRGKPYHGVKTQDGNLVGTTDSDYFYFFCPDCKDRHVMRLLGYEIRDEKPSGSEYRDEKPIAEKDFVLAFKLYCPKCKLTDFVKIGNTGRQGGQLPS